MMIQVCIRCNLENVVVSAAAMVHSGVETTGLIAISYTSLAILQDLHLVGQRTLYCSRSQGVRQEAISAVS
jgi:hypothetical protein